MSRQITSPVKRYPGNVLLADPLTFPAFQKFVEALDKANAAELQSDYDAAILPGVIACVERWEIGNFPEVVTAETFPATPRKASNQIIMWLVREITKLITEADEVPNK